jgi:hypothetical protein
VRRPGLRVESEVGLVFEEEVVEEDEDLSTEDGPGWLGLVIVPLGCFVVIVGDDEDEEEDPRVVSFSSKEHY